MLKLNQQKILNTTEPGKPNKSCMNLTISIVQMSFAASEYRDGTIFAKVGLIHKTKQEAPMKKSKSFYHLDLYSFSQQRAASIKSNTRYNYKCKSKRNYPHLRRWFGLYRGGGQFQLKQGFRFSDCVKDSSIQTSSQLNISIQPLIVRLKLLSTLQIIFQKLFKNLLMALNIHFR